MMNGLEKSDPAIVAMKPANKAGQPVAERVEPRAGAKGNTDQPRTRRTQSRDSVSPGLARVRDAARQRKRGNNDSAPVSSVSTVTHDQAQVFGEWHLHRNARSGSGIFCAQGQTAR